jgi:hypothetical protein
MEELSLQTWRNNTAHIRILDGPIEKEVCYEGQTWMRYLLRILDREDESIKCLVCTRTLLQLFYPAVLAGHSEFEVRVEGAGKTLRYYVQPTDIVKIHRTFVKHVYQILCRILHAIRTLIK